jgi:REP element-mobilizing transposase RayT
MARSLRIEYPDAFYHVIARGNRRDVIFLDDVDRRMEKLNPKLSKELRIGNNCQEMSPDPFLRYPISRLYM